MQDNVVGAIAIVCVFGLPVVAWITMRILKHHERMEMLRRGMMPPPEFTDKNAYKAWRRAGSPWPPPGAAPPPQQAVWTPQQAAPVWTSPEDDPQRALYKGIRLALIGFAITFGLGIAFHGFSGNPMILAGLIPMFVGIAQIIIALLSGAQLPGVDPRITFIPPPQPPPGAPQPPPHPGFGSATPPPWADQPGRQRFEELSKPVPPPDLR
jgi:hypothetical protein